MAVETGPAAFGQKHQYGVLTKEDSIKLIRLAVLGALAHPSEGYAARQLIRRMLFSIGAADAVMLAQLMRSALTQQAEWVLLAEELEKKAGF